ncbi:MAG: hypothetical protein R2823_03085 [Acidimicrobiia bacterium]
MTAPSQLPGMNTIPAIHTDLGEGIDLGYTVEVRTSTPFLPKVAFVTITLASIAGAIFTGRSFGLGLGLGLMRWFILWTMALTLGFAAWRTMYLRTTEKGLSDERMRPLADSALAHARPISRILAAFATVSTAAVAFVPYLSTTQQLWLMIATGATAALLWRGVATRRSGAVIVAGAAAQAAMWGSFDAAAGLPEVVRTLHLVAFGLWLGGALWNLGVAIPAGRDHPTIEAVIALARQLQRFRWVVRFAMPTVIITGLIQTDVYRAMPADWWMSMPGILIPAKVLLIVALIGIFITCPLYRQCSPVTGVCRVEDLDDTAPDR